MFQCYIRKLGFNVVKIKYVFWVPLFIVFLKYLHSYESKRKTNMQVLQKHYYLFISKGLRPLITRKIEASLYVNTLHSFAVWSFQLVNWHISVARFKCVIFTLFPLWLMNTSVYVYYRFMFIYVNISFFLVDGFATIHTRRKKITPWHSIMQTSQKLQTAFWKRFVFVRNRHLKFWWKEKTIGTTLYISGGPIVFY